MVLDKRYWINGIWEIVFDKVYLIKGISAVTNYNSSSCFIWMEDNIILLGKRRSFKENGKWIYKTDISIWIYTVSVSCSA